MVRSHYLLPLLCFWSRIKLNDSNPALFLSALTTCLDVAVPNLSGKSKKTAEGFGILGKVVRDILTGDQSTQFQEEINQKLAEISGKLELMNDHITQQTKDIGKIVSYHAFSQQFLVPVLSLVAIMQDMVKHPNSRLHDVFLKECANTDPISIAYKLHVYMIDVNTNPFVYAMESDMAKSNKTYQKWKSTAAYLMSSCARLDAVLSGLKNVAVAEIEKSTIRIEEKHEEIAKDMNRIAENYANSYWPNTVITLIKDSLTRQMGQNDRAMFLGNVLGEIYTRDEFFIFIYEYERNRRFNSITSNEDHLQCENSGVDRICVYRSKLFHMYNNAGSLTQFKTAVATYRGNPSADDKYGELLMSTQKMFDNMKVVGMVAFIAFQPTLYTGSSIYPVTPTHQLEASVRALPNYRIGASVRALPKYRIGGLLYYQGGVLIVGLP